VSFSNNLDIEKQGRGKKKKVQDNKKRTGNIWCKSKEKELYYETPAPQSTELRRERKKNMHKEKRSWNQWPPGKRVGKRGRGDPW